MIISWISAFFLVFGFIVLIRLFGLVNKSSKVVAISRHSFEVIRNSTLNDEEKETALQKNTKLLLQLFFILAFGGIIALLFPVGILWGCDRIGLISLRSTLSVATSPFFLIISGVLALLALFVPGKKTSEKTDYSTLDQCLFRVAFKTCAAQVSLADLEDRLFARQLNPLKAERPVFITALPRAGTTLLLECFTKLQEFASHCYRDMPFVLTPCFWNRFSKMFQRSGTLQERAHGDGMLINYDSPEALEEVLWQAFWHQHYLNDRIIPWQNESDDEFTVFFKSHMRKIILLRRGPGVHTARYISKNNLNIARTDILRQLFPDSIIIVPFRQPLHHTTSLMEQHRNFLHLHEKDPFSREYMQAIGHYDFGKNLHPIDFDGWLDKRQSKDTKSIAFWLEYWVVTYKYLLRHKDNLFFFNYDALCKEPTVCLQRLAKTVQSKNGNTLVSAVAHTIHTPKPREVDTASIDPSLLKESNNIYKALKDITLC